MKHNINEVYHDDRCLVPCVSMVGHWRYQRAVSAVLDMHMHEHEYEICYIAEGSVDWWVEEELHEVNRGHFYVTKPEERHGSLDANAQPSEIYWVVFKLPEEASVVGLTLDESRQLSSDFSRLCSRVFPAGPDCAMSYQRLLSTVRNPDAYSAVTARSAFHALLVDVLASEREYRRRQSGASTPISARIREAADWMERHLDEHYRIEDAARVAGMSVSAFYKHFLAEVGLTPADYRVRGRIRQAKVRLREGIESITTIAIDLGFSSSQYFASVFKTFVGITPQAYRNPGPAPARRHTPAADTAGPP